MGFLRGLFDRMCPTVLPDGDKSGILRSDEELDIEKEVETGSSLGWEADRLVDELKRVGYEEGFLSSESLPRKQRKGIPAFEQPEVRRCSDWLFPTYASA